MLLNLRRGFYFSHHFWRWHNSIERDIIHNIFILLRRHIKLLYSSLKGTSRSRGGLGVDQSVYVSSKQEGLFCALTTSQHILFLLWLKWICSLDRECLRMLRYHHGAHNSVTTRSSPRIHLAREGLLWLDLSRLRTITLYSLLSTLHSPLSTFSSMVFS